MTSLRISATEEAQSYLEEIAVEMTQMFGISREEAYGRINDQLGRRTFLTEIEVSNLKHEEQDVWAKHIFFGRQSFWWLDEDGAVPLPYDPSTRT